MSANDVPAGIDPDLWATMTDEERAGITEPGYSAADQAALAAIAGSGDDDENDDGDGDGSANTPATGAGADDAEAPGSTGSTDQAAGGDGAKDATPAGDAAPAATRAAAQPDPVVPVYRAKLPDDYDARVAANAEAKNSAWSRFDSGDLTREELQAELSRIDAEGLELRDMKLKSEVASEMTAQTAEQQWVRAVQRNTAEFAKPENGGIDYAQDETKRADLDHFVKALANDPKNEDKSMDWFLQEAHKRVRALHGLSEPVKRDTPADANARRAPNLSAVPANLAQVPGGDGPGDVAGEFADVDRLEGDALESAIANMTPAQRERYAAGR